jgi:hypothetical protein
VGWLWVSIAMQMLVSRLSNQQLFEWSWWGQVPHMYVGPRGATVHACQWRAMTVRLLWRSVLLAACPGPTTAITNTLISSVLWEIWAFVVHCGTQMPFASRPGPW